MSNIESRSNASLSGTEEVPELNDPDDFELTVYDVPVADVDAASELDRNFDIDANGDLESLKTRPSELESKVFGPFKTDNAPKELVAYWTFDFVDQLRNVQGNRDLDGIPIGDESIGITDAPQESVRGRGALKLKSGDPLLTDVYIDVQGIVAEEGQKELTVVGWYQFADLDGDGSPPINCLWSIPEAQSFESALTVSLGLDDTDGDRDLDWTWTTSAPKKYAHTVGPVVNDSDWHHAAVTWNQETGSVNYYHDGRLFDVGTIRGRFRDLPQSSGFRIGSSLSNIDSDNWDGFIDDVAVFKSELNAAQIWALYEGTATPLDVIQVKPSNLPDEPMSFVDGSWSMAVIPDTQHYTSGPRNSAIFDTITDWISSNKDARNIQVVLHVGDITNSNKLPEWHRAKSALGVLDGRVPYILTLGNHDYKGGGGAIGCYRCTLMNSVFSMNYNPFLAGVFKEGELNNAYYEFIAPDGRKMIVFALEWAPRQDVVDWAYDIIRGTEGRYADYTAVLLTHAYMFNDDLRIDWNDMARIQPHSPHDYSGTLITDHDGRELFDDLVSPVANFEFTFSGHVAARANDEDGMGFLRSDIVGTDHDHAVNQTLFDTQCLGNGGNGWILLVEFLPDGTSVLQKIYSPFLDSWRNEVEILQVSPI
jgi:hypothetical protein